MSDLERRALLGVAGLGAMAALAKAGPLTPPAGAVAPTGRTLDEVYNRISPSGAGNGRTPLVPGAGTTIITAPGSYVLTGPITRSGVCLQINVSGVDVDLNGYTIDNSNPTTNTVSIAVAAANVHVHNGTIIGGVRGVAAGTSTHGLRLSELSISNAKVAGIALGSGSIGNRIEDCRIIDTGASSTAADGNLSILAMDCSSTPGLRVRACQVVRLFYNGTGTPVFRGISCSGVGTVVEDCQVVNEVAITGTAYFMVNALYKNNLATNFSVGYSNGTNGGGNV